MHFEQKNKRETAKEMRERKARRKQEGELIGQKLWDIKLENILPKIFYKGECRRITQTGLFKIKMEEGLVKNCHFVINLTLEEAMYDFTDPYPRRGGGGRKKVLQH